MKAMIGFNAAACSSDQRPRSPWVIRPCACTAAAWGLANEVVDDEDLLTHARCLAEEIAETDPVSMAKIHGLIDDGLGLSREEAFALERRVFDAHMAGLSAATIESNRKTVQARGKRVAGGAA